MESRSRPTPPPLVDNGATQPPEARASVGRKVLTLALICVPLFICVPGITATVLLPALRKAKMEARGRLSGNRCSNNLRLLGLAAIQYSDDKRFFPHVNALRTLDGGVDTNTSTKIVRTLLTYGYHDQPEAWICPISYDTFVPKSGQKPWFWEGVSNPVAGSRSPLSDGSPDPTLEQTDELSYGWTRKGMNRNVRSNALLAADRAVRDPEALKAVGPVLNANEPVTGIIGNHSSGWNVLKADATVEWFDLQLKPYPGGFLTGTSSANGGYLGLKVQADPTRLGR